jgi:hypothetical protein
VFYIIIIGYLVCVIGVIIADRVITRGSGPGYRDWSTTLLMGALGPITLILLAFLLIRGDRR